MRQNDYTPSVHLVGYQPQRQVASPASTRLAWASLAATVLAVVVLNVAFPEPAPASCTRPQMAAIDGK